MKLLRFQFLALLWLMAAIFLPRTIFAADVPETWDPASVVSRMANSNTFYNFLKVPREAALDEILEKSQRLRDYLPQSQLKEEKIRGFLRHLDGVARVLTYFRGSYDNWVDNLNAQRVKDNGEYGFRTRELWTVFLEHQILERRKASSDLSDEDTLVYLARTPAEFMDALSAFYNDDEHTDLHLRKKPVYIRRFTSVQAGSEKVGTVAETRVNSVKFSERLKSFGYSTAFTCVLAIVPFGAQYFWGLRQGEPPAKEIFDRGVQADTEKKLTEAREEIERLKKMTDAGSQGSTPAASAGLEQADRGLDLKPANVAPKK